METTVRPSSIPQGRRNLAAVARHADDLVRIDDAVSALGLTRPPATKLLWRWARQGWLRRVGPGTYALAQLDSIDSDQGSINGRCAMEAAADFVRHKRIEEHKQFGAPTSLGD